MVEVRPLCFGPIVDVHRAPNNDGNDGQPSNEPSDHGTQSNPSEVFVEVGFAFVGVNFVYRFGNGQGFDTADDEYGEDRDPKRRGGDF